jgi:sugar phosphate isomerase/epimerase
MDSLKDPASLLSLSGESVLSAEDGLMMRNMHNLGRRSFLQGAATMLPFATLAGKAAQGGQQLANIGVELYTVRDVILKDPAATLKSIQDIGYTEVEAIYATLDKIWPALEQTKLKPVSVHVDSDLFGNDSKMQTALENVRKRGFQYAVYPYLPIPERGGLEAIKKLAAKLNKAGEQAQKLGLTLCYHNHAFEFQPMEGTIPLDVLLKETTTGLVSLELDIFWASVAGHDPVEILNRYASRIALVHLKDKEKGLPVRYNENVAKGAFKEVGRGSIDIAGVLRAATTNGVKHFFVEQDQTPGNPLDSLKISYQYLHNLSF